MLYSALLRLDRSIGREQRLEIVESALEILGLGKVFLTRLDST